MVVFEADVDVAQQQFVILEIEQRKRGVVHGEGHQQQHCAHGRREQASQGSRTIPKDVAQYELPAKVECIPEGRNLLQ